MQFQVAIDTDPRSWIMLSTYTDQIASAGLRRAVEAVSVATIPSAFHSPKRAQLSDDELNISNSLAAPRGKARVVKEILGQHHTRNGSIPTCQARTRTLKMQMQMRTKWMIMGMTALKKRIEQVMRMKQQLTHLERATRTR